MNYLVLEIDNYILLLVKSLNSEQFSYQTSPHGICLPSKVTLGQIHELNKWIYPLLFALNVLGI